MFEKGFAAVRGADRAAYEAAAKQLAPAVSILESIMAEYGRHVAGDLVSRLYDDVGKIHENIQWYEPSEVLDWLNRMQDELPAFEGRMASMCDAAIDSDMFERLCENLRRHDFTIVRGNELAVPDQPLPLAWALIANRN